MTEPEIVPAQPPASANGAAEGLLTLTHVIYGLHTLSVIIGIAGTATVIGSFVGGLPSIIAVILNYVKRSDVRGTWLDSHFSWQIRTFWYAALWIVVSVVLALTVIGIPVAFVLVAGATLWIIYRVIRGWLALKNRTTLPV